MTQLPSATIAGEIRSRTHRLLEALARGLYEREEPIRLALLSTVAGESIFLLGPPGVGKSLIARRLKFAFHDGTAFEYLMSKFSTPDEIFGPVSIRKLKEEDTYERLTDRYLPGANIVFLDEIWKAGPAIQNALLTILNEKIYRNGKEDVQVNIRGIITASNELPPQQTNLAPIWDRFLLRLELGNIRRFDNFLSMITATDDVYADDVPEEAKLSVEELDEWSDRIDSVSLPPEVLNTIQVIKIKIAEHNQRLGGGGHPIVVHDRRWKKAVRLLRTSAFLNGRDRVDLMDCFLLLDCLWSRPEQREDLKTIVSEAVRKHGYTMAVNLTALKREVRDFEADVEQETQIRHTVEDEVLLSIEDDYFELVKTDNTFKGNYVTIKQFRQLQLDEPTVTNFYDAEKNLVNRLRARKGSEEHTLEIDADSQRQIFSLRTKIAERTETITKQPHPIVQRHWDEQYQRLTTFIEGQLERMENEPPHELKSAASNFFVDNTYAEVVSTNYKEVTEALRSLKLRLEKLQYAYTNH